MKKIVTVIASVSRNAGGLFESVRNLSLAIDEQRYFNNVIMGLEDEHTAEDVGSWRPLDVHLQKVVGPKSFGYSPLLVSKLKAERPDVIHNHGIWMYPSFAVHRSSCALDIPYIISPHGMLDPWAVRHSRWKKVLAHHAFEAAHLGGANCIRALCDSEAKAIRAYGLRNPICVIPNGINLPDETPAPRPACLSHVSADKHILLYLGRIHPKKGIPNLISAWAQLPSHEWHLVIAGWDQGNHQAELMRMAADARVETSVTFVGPQFGEAKRVLYQHSDAFVLPSYSEGLPMVVLEAWSHRLPTLITPECNLPEGFNAGAAVKIEAEVESVRSGLESLFSLSPDERGEMGAKGRALVEREFTWPRIGEQMGDVYRWLLGESFPATVQMD